MLIKGQCKFFSATIVRPCAALPCSLGNFDWQQLKAVLAKSWYKIKRFFQKKFLLFVL